MKIDYNYARNSIDKQEHKLASDDDLRSMQKICHEQVSGSIGETFRAKMYFDLLQSELDSRASEKNYHELRQSIQKLEKPHLIAWWSFWVALAAAVFAGIDLTLKLFQAH